MTVLYGIRGFGFSFRRGHLERLFLRGGRRSILWLIDRSERIRVNVGVEDEWLMCRFMFEGILRKVDREKMIMGVGGGGK